MSDLIKIARERLDGTQSSHREGCERSHPECLIQRMADEIERLRAVLVAAKGLNAESEEYDFDYGLGRAAPNSYWEELDDAIEAIDAAKEQR